MLMDPRSFLTEKQLKLAKPHSVDLLIEKVYKVKGGSFNSNTDRRIFKDEIHLFVDIWVLRSGAYQLECGSIEIPLDKAGFVMGRSTLNRLGATTAIGLFDPGFKGLVGASITLPEGVNISIQKDIPVIQMVFVSVEVSNQYNGFWQQK
jgi:deoxycytidine triphosphate deaminase